jgi:hypothetical protein
MAQTASAAATNHRTASLFEASWLFFVRNNAGSLTGFTPCDLYFSLLLWESCQKVTQSSNSSFDPTRSVEFDLESGQVRVGGSPPRLVIPADSVLRLASDAGDEKMRDFAQQLGNEIARRATLRLGDISQASMQSVAEHIGGEFALMGLGSVGLERWGQALVIVIEASPLGAAGDSLLAAIIEGVTKRAAGRDVNVVMLAREGAKVRYLITGDQGAQKTCDLLQSGKPWGAALAELK